MEDGMATSQKGPQPESMAAYAEFFLKIAQREQYAEEVEARARAAEEREDAANQRYQARVDDLHGIEAVILERQATFDDLHSALPKAQVAFEESMLPLRREKAELQEDVRRLQAHQRTLQEQNADAERALSQIKSEIMGGQQMARARTFAPVPSLSGPVIISPNPLADDHLPEEASA
jgi:chromosome segregation ATPase